MTCVLILHIHSPFDMYTKRGTGSQGIILTITKADNTIAKEYNKRKKICNYYKIEKHKSHGD